MGLIIGFSVTDAGRDKGTDAFSALETERDEGAEPFSALEAGRGCENLGGSTLRVGLFSIGRGCRCAADSIGVDLEDSTGVELLAMSGRPAARRAETDITRLRVGPLLASPTGIPCTSSSAEVDRESGVGAIACIEEPDA